MMVQKYRLHTRRPNATATVQSTGFSASAGAALPVPQFIVVGGIWVPPPPDYAAAAAQPAGGDAPGTTTTAAGRVYALVARCRPSAAAAAGPAEAVERVLRRPAQRRRQVGLACRVVVVAHHFRLINTPRRHLPLLDPSRCRSIRRYRL